jgi:YVTN family beta-propeller protein
MIKIIHLPKTIFLVLVLFSFLISETKAQTTSSDFKIQKIIPIKGTERGWDYLAVDSVHHRLFISRSTHVLVVNLDNDSLMGEIPKTLGVHGIAFAYDLNRGFTSNGHANSVSVFDLSSLKVIDTIAVTGADPDCIAYDPFSHRVFTFNGDSGSSTVIDAKELKVIGTIHLGGSPEFAVADGEGNIFNNLEDKSEIIKINTSTLKIEARWPLAPGESPSGLSYDKINKRLFSGCHDTTLVVMNAENGKIISTIRIGHGVDATTYDASRKLVYSSNGDGTLTVIQQTDADHYSVLQNVVTQKGARTCALDVKTHTICLVTADYSTGRNTVPGTFRLLILGK